MAKRLDKVVEGLQDTDPTTKRLLTKLALLFERGCPEFLEYDPYKLAEVTAHKETDDWFTFLSVKEIGNWIDERLNITMETNYRKLMREMANKPDLNTADINSAKLLREVVKENKRVDDSVKIIITRIPPKNRK